MDSRYRGENEGKYIDPVTGNRWQVKYFSPSEKMAYEIFIRDGLFVNREGERMDSPFDESLEGLQQGLIVIDRDLRIYFMNREERGRIHHSSLAAGEDILFAGTAGFVNGQLRELSNSSGHYKPSTEQTLLALRRLHQQGANLKALQLSGEVAMSLGKSHFLNTTDVRKLLPDLSAN